MTERGSAKSGGAATVGIAAGIVALGCCVGPAVAALLGLSSAAVAIDLATNLYSEWGWAFKIAGMVSAVMVVALARRRSRQCGTRPRLMKFTVVLVGTGLATYAVLYAGTTWLGQQA
ncbi:MAG: hypothetical protein M3391_07715 [Actinomycetota bacterium]|nr:hypothetical protein [Actinomycetota bacterium]